MFFLGFIAIVFILFSVKRLNFSYIKSLAYVNESIKDTRESSDWKLFVIIVVTWVINLLYLSAVARYGFIPRALYAGFIVFMAACFAIEYFQLKESIKYNRFWFFFDAFQNTVVGLLSVWTVVSIIKSLGGF